MKRRIITVWYYNGVEEHQYVEGHQPEGYVRGRKPNLISEESKQKMIENQKKHFQEKYGVDWPAQLLEIQEKRKKTTLERYGVVCYLNLPEVKEKVSKYSKSKEAIIKRSKTNLEKYGVENVYQAEEIKEKIKQTNLERYGVANIFQLPKVRKKAKKGVKSKVAVEKRKQTNISKYGVDNYVKSIEYHKKARKRYNYNGISFDSSWELAVYIYAIDHNMNIERAPVAIEYEHNGIIHNYIPDFRINGKLVEIKSDHFFLDGKMINPYNRLEDDIFEAKHQCMIENNVEIWKYEEIKLILKYLEEKYSKNWLNHFIKKGN